MPEYRCDKCGNTFRRVISVDCQVCGATDSFKQISSSDATADDSADVIPYESAADSPLEFWEIVRDLRDTYKRKVVLLTGACIIVLGMSLVFISDLRDDPRRIGTNDIVRGSFTALVGLIVFAFAIFFLRKSAKGSR